MDKKRPVILAVDDDPLGARMFERFLPLEGFSVITVRNGDEALKRAETDPIDLILLDVVMPGMDGIETCKKLRAMENIAHVPIIFLTGMRKEVEEVVRGLDSGADDYLLKPVNLEELSARIHSMLRMKRLYDENERLLEEVTVQKKVLEEELEMARKVQGAFLTASFPYPDRIRVVSRYLPARSVGGDFFDVMDLADNRVAILMSDVSGHGPSAALIVGVIKTLMVSNTFPDGGPEAWARYLNDRLLRLIPDERYITLFFGILDLTVLELSYVVAGHPPPFLIRPGREGVIDLERGGTVLGMYDSVDLRPAAVSLRKGDKIMAYSDGLFEVTRENGDMYGWNRLKSAVEGVANASAEEIVDRILDGVHRFSEKDLHPDDIAILLVEIL